MDEIKAECGNCRYYIGQSCHRFPPTHTASGGLGFWNIVRSDAWCGEWGYRNFFIQIPEEPLSKETGDGDHRAEEE